MHHILQKQKMHLFVSIAYLNLLERLVQEIFLHFNLSIEQCIRQFPKHNSQETVSFPAQFTCFSDGV